MLPATPPRLSDTRKGSVKDLSALCRLRPQCDGAAELVRYSLKSSRESARQQGKERLMWRGRQGLSLRHFQKIEAGDVNVTLATLVRVAKAFRIPVKSLFEETKR